jgi:alpha-galactosidase
MSVEDAAPTVFSADNDAATALLHMRAQGVSVLMQLKPTGLPVILHWGADLGDLDGLTADALLAAFGPTGLDPIPSMMSSLLPEASAGWNSRAALAGSHDGHASAASFAHSHARLISETPVMPGLIETGADTVIIEATDAVNKLGLDVAIQLTVNGLVRCRAGVTNKNIADYRVEGLELFLPVSDLATHRVEFDGPAGPPRPRGARYRFSSRSGMASPRCLQWCGATSGGANGVRQDLSGWRRALAGRGDRARHR